MTNYCEVCEKDDVELKHFEELNRYICLECLDEPAFPVTLTFRNRAEKYLFLGNLSDGSGENLASLEYKGDLYTTEEINVRLLDMEEEE